jgi:V-type H+-transporting ATPase subunit F
LRGCQVADKIRGTVDRYQAAFPALLEIPSKDFPYGAFDGVSSSVRQRLMIPLLAVDPEKDSVLKRVQKLRGD